MLLLILLTGVFSCRPPQPTTVLDLSRGWRFAADTSDMGKKEGWYAPAYDDSSWDTLDAGRRWEDQGYPRLDGIAWYRRHVTIPSSWNDQAIWIRFEGVNDTYDLYVNGHHAATFAGRSYAGHPTFVRLDSLLHPGKGNVLAVRVNDWGNSGGLWRLPVVLTTNRQLATHLFEPISDEPFDPAAAGYVLAWHDEFDSSALDTARWRYRALGPRRGGFGTPHSVSLRDGLLLIRTCLRNDTLWCGAVSTEGKHLFRYGYFECRARLPRTQGPWAAFWIQSPLIAQGEDPALYGTEIDVMEYFRNHDTDLVAHTLHWAYGPHQQTTGSYLSRVNDPTGTFHTYAVEWTPEGYAFYVDSLKYHEVKVGVSHIGEAVILSYEPPDSGAIDPSELPDTFFVDYVRIWQKKNDPQ